MMLRHPRGSLVTYLGSQKQGLCAELIPGIRALASADEGRQVMITTCQVVVVVGAAILRLCFLQ